MSVSRFLGVLFGAIALATTPHLAQAEDTLRLAVGAPNNWDTSIPEIGQRAGIFAKHGLKLDILYTQGGGETMQAVISGSVDIGIAAGTQAVMGAFAKGAPVRILAAGTTGAGDLYWYVPADSPIKSFKDTNGKTAGFSTVGASTHIALLALIKHFGTTTKAVATGAGAVTLTQVMSGQIDVGWASPPFGLQQLQDGKIRLIARGNDAPSMVNQTVRVHIVNANALKQRADVMKRFMAAYRESYEFLYTDPRGVRVFSEYSKVPEALAVQIRDTFMPKAVMSPEKVSGTDAIMADAVTFKTLAAPLSQQQLSELIQIPPKP
ncbi:ABC transporter substrate-binding protein [Pseudolabrys taiwanensis]|uniref:ABC transporter substrate-binding protein n=1 Tax=Pseudolabrys taiwanensis TaxID=331696 RepID=A0A345ZW07_9HYPH|nr:ABC transporter substrate-binding protein [Pseudolabrys taiwanensis]AXK81104.1 ABC transporter substrate-binding protein [Pseudolabrys taiwanensis]